MDLTCDCKSNDLERKDIRIAMSQWKAYRSSARALELDCDSTIVIYNT